MHGYEYVVGSSNGALRKGVPWFGSKYSVLANHHSWRLSEMDFTSHSAHSDAHLVLEMSRTFVKQTINSCDEAQRSYKPRRCVSANAHYVWGPRKRKSGKCGFNYSAAWETLIIFILTRVVTHNLQVITEYWPLTSTATVKVASTLQHMFNFQCDRCIQSKPARFPSSPAQSTIQSIGTRICRSIFTYRTMNPNPLHRWDIRDACSGVHLFYRNMAAIRVGSSVICEW